MFYMPLKSGRFYVVVITKVMTFLTSCVNVKRAGSFKMSYFHNN